VQVNEAEKNNAPEKRRTAHRGKQRTCPETKWGGSVRNGWKIERGGIRKKVSQSVKQVGFNSFVGD